VAAFASFDLFDRFVGDLALLVAQTRQKRFRYGLDLCGGLGVLIGLARVEGLVQSPSLTLVIVRARLRLQ
jgi:hypothetical protein